jgi:hypothetical protein
MATGKIFDLQKGDVLPGQAVQPFDPQHDSSNVPNGVNAGKTPTIRFDTFLSDVDVNGKPTA